MQHVQSLTQAYSQSPWRKQLQIIGAFLLTLVTVWMVAAIYLDVTARAAAMGREVQEMQVSTRSLSVNAQSLPGAENLSIEELKQIIADLQTQMAYLTSDETMEKRAREMGFEPVSPDQILYIQVPGYVPRQEAQLAPPPGAATLSSNVASPSVPPSLIDWLKEEFLRASDMLKGAQP